MKFDKVLYLVLKFIIQSGHHRKKTPQRKSMEAHKCETADANQISASMTKSKHTHTQAKKHTLNVMLSCLEQEEVDVFKIGFKVVGGMPMVVSL